MTDGVNLRQAQNGDSLTKLIGEKLKSENGGNEVRLSGSVWNQILDIVDEQQQSSGDVYSGGSERKNWSQNYVLLVGQVVTFTNEVWNRIKSLAGLNVEQKTENTPSESSFIVPAEIDLVFEDSGAKRITNPDGSVKYVVTEEGENVRYSSMDIEYNSEGKLIGYVQHFPEGDMAFDAKGRLLPNGINAVQPSRNAEQQAEYKKTLDDAKNILIDKAEILELTKEEVELIKNIEIESINYGAARFDRKYNVLLFNINDRNSPNKNEFVKVIIHELTHGTKGNSKGKNSQSEERMCETRALKAALKLIDMGVIDDFTIPSMPQPINISSLSDDLSVDNYVKEWIKLCNYTNLPETPEEE